MVCRDGLLCGMMCFMTVFACDEWLFMPDLVGCYYGLLHFVFCLVYEFACFVVCWCAFYWLRAVGLLYGFDLDVSCWWVCCGLYPETLRFMLDLFVVFMR